MCFQQFLSHPGWRCALLALLMLPAAPLVATEPVTGVRIYIDADRTGTRAAGVAIERGLRTALSEIDNRLDGREVEVVIRDHRGSSPRSKRHLQEYLDDSLALAVFAGLHSPPLLAHREYINQNHILILDPWAAAGPITRHPSKDNWIFRLSIDDSKAGYVIARSAIQGEGFEKPYLLLEDTGWGKSNLRTMTRAVGEMGIVPAGIQWFNWNLGLSGAKIMLRKAVSAGADVIFLVANAPEGKTFARAMTALPAETRLPIRSHWGITGGDFPSAIDSQMRTRDLQLKVMELQGKDRINQHMLTLHALDETLELVLEVIYDLMELDRAIVYLKEDDGLKPRAAIGVCGSGRTVLSEDLESFDVMAERDREFQIIEECREPVNVTRSEDESSPPFALVPIVRGDNLLGAIAVARRPGHPISEDEVHMLASFGLQAAVAISDAQVQRDFNSWQHQLSELRKEAERLDVIHGA